MNNPLPDLYRGLAALTAPWTADRLIPHEQQLQCRAIGIRLDELGGFEAMEGAYNHAITRNPCASVVQAYWDNIGEWRW
jgi:hypothetical protein